MEHLVESEDLGLEVLHPGGLEITRELAELCHIGPDSKVLDVASGTGESACYLAANFGCRVVGVDASDFLIERAKKKTGGSHLPVEFQPGDAHHLPFDENTFDVVMSECTICVLDKERALREMVRVATPGGYIGIHDICWQEGAPEHLKHRLAEIEGEEPETLDGWKSLFEKAGLIDIRIVDKSPLIPLWMREVKKTLGITGQLRIFLKVIKTWGIHGFRRLRESEQIFQSQYMGYGLVVGRKP